MKVVVVGAGVVGLAAAYYLKKQGAIVELVDQGEPGMACSWGNLGWVCPSLSEPVPAPGVVSQSLQSMARGRGPLHIAPGALPALFSWLMSFRRHCTPENYDAACRALLRFNQSTFQLYDALSDDHIDFEHHKHGLLFAFLQEEALKQRLAHFGPLEEYGFSAPRLLTRHEVLIMEPSLTAKIVGGIWLPDERHVRADTLTSGLTQWLRSHDTVFQTSVKVIGGEWSDKMLHGLKTETSLIEGDRYLLAAGAWTGPLVAQLGSWLPITAAKGYSITINEPNLQFTHPVYFGDDRTEITPYCGALRLGGILELSGINTRLHARRIQEVRGSVRRYLDAELLGQSQIEWTGMRPIAPDGLPILGMLPGFDNVFVATGHAMMGVTMALVTGRAMASLITDDEDLGDSLAAFSPNRFFEK